MSSKNGTVFLVQKLAVYKNVLFLLHGRAPDTIR